MCAFFSDRRDVKLAILEKLPEFAGRPDLCGWIPGMELVNAEKVIREIEDLRREIQDLESLGL